MNEYIKSEITEDDLNTVVLLDNNYEVTLVNFNSVYATVYSTVEYPWVVVKNRLKRIAPIEA